MALAANMLLVALSLSMGIRLLLQYSRRPRAHTLYYGVGLALIASAALPEVYRELAGGLPTLLWWLYWVSASAAVGFLGVGTAYLLSPRVGKAALLTAALLTAAVVVAVVTTAGPAPAQFTEATFAKAPNGWIKTPFLIQNIAGSLMILGGATVSFLKTRALYSVWIAVGTLLFAAGGGSAGLLAYSKLFYFTQAAGIVLLYAGVALSVRPGAARSSPGSAKI